MLAVASLLLISIAAGVPVREMQGPNHSEDVANQIAAKFQEMDREFEAEGCVKGQVSHAIVTSDGGYILLAHCREWKKEVSPEPDKTKGK